MPELARLRRRIRMLFVLVAGLAALCCYAFLRRGPELHKGPTGLML